MPCKGINRFHTMQSIKARLAGLGPCSHRFGPCGAALVLASRREPGVNSLDISRLWADIQLRQHALLRSHREARPAACSKVARPQACQPCQREESESAPTSRCREQGEGTLQS